VPSRLVGAVHVGNQPLPDKEAAEPGLHAPNVLLGDAALEAYAMGDDAHGGAAWHCALFYVSVLRLCFTSLFYVSVLRIWNDS
jgi:hypothetical protein